MWREIPIDHMTWSCVPHVIKTCPTYIIRCNLILCYQLFSCYRVINMERVTFLLSLLVASVFCFPENVVEFEQPEEEGKHWALLVAGSNGYFNYRHQVN